MLKLKGSHLLQSASELMVDAIGVDAAAHCTDDMDPEANAGAPAYAQGVVSDFLYRRASTIYGGSAEIQRNIIASSLFGAG